MKTITATAVIALMFAMLSLAGCGTMGILDPMGQHPYAYEATRGEDRTTAQSERDAAAAAAEAAASKDSKGKNNDKDE